MIASHVIFVALLIEEVDTVSVDMRMLCASFTVIGCEMLMPFPFVISILFALQTKRVATPEQLN